MFITSIFRSLQGESTYQGLPCTFIRLSECNLRCLYCDTKYSYQRGKSFSIKEVIDAICEYPLDLVEITGGEPLLQEKEVISLCHMLLTLKIKVLIETNGSIDISTLPAEVIKIMDVKCPGSGMHENNLLSNFSKLNKDDQIKFVIKDRNDFDWSIQIVRKYKLLENAIVIFSTVAGELSLENMANWILETKLGIRMQIQLHKYIWLNSNKEV